MRVTNKTRSVINYRGQAYGPNRSFDLDDTDAAKRGTAAQIAAGHLEVTVGGSDKKPSDGLNVEQLKQALIAAGVDFDANAKKVDLAALLDASAV